MKEILYTYLYMHLETAYFITFNYTGIHKSMNLDKKKFRTTYTRCPKYYK